MGETHLGDQTSVQICAGRLVHLRIGRLATLGDVQSQQAALVAALRRVGRDAIICADYRRARPMLPEVASAWSRAMRRNNACILRGGLLLDPANRMLNLQVERVVRCAAHPVRRLFTDAEALREWIGLVSSDREREVLDGLLPR